MSELNDPRVLFAAERTLLAWSRTSVSLMAFGFVIERFGIFLQNTKQHAVSAFERHASFFIGESFVILAALLAFYSIWQHKQVIKNLKPNEIPVGYNLSLGIVLNAIIGGLGVILSAYLVVGFL
ncbi:MAG: YidH family protein [Acidiferrobacterales bacterium]